MTKKEYSNRYYKENKARLKIIQDEWKKKNPDYHKAYKKKNIASCKKHQKKYYAKKKAEKLKEARRYYKENPSELMRLDGKDWNIRFAVMSKKQKSDFDKLRRELASAKQKARYQEKKIALSKKRITKVKTKNNDSLRKITIELRKRTIHSIKRTRWVKNGGSEALLGGSLQEVRNHIESLFYSGMKWDNHGVLWHLDHVIPLSTAKDKDHLIGLCHHLNLQPLLADENINKSDKMPWDWVNSL